MRVTKSSEERREPSWTRNIRATGVPFVALIVLLCGCLDQRAPSLEVSPSTELNMSSERSSVVVRNIGGQLLDWTVESDDKRVSLSPAAGRLFSSGTSTVHIRIEQGPVDKGELLTATLLFRSNGGSKEMLVRFSPESGIGRCDDHQPYELPLVRAGVSGRSAVPGWAAVPVGNEILVAYRDLFSGAAGVAFENPSVAAEQRPFPGAQAPSGTAAATLRLRAQLQAEVGLTLVRAGAGGGPDLYRSGGAPDDAIADLLADPRVAYAQRNFYLELLALPDDPLLQTMQWNLMEFGLPAAWEVYNGDSAAADVVLAIVDSGIYGDHPDLAPKLLPGWDFHGKDPDTSPGEPHVDNDAAHGTHVAGIAAALGDNGIGISGVAYGSAVKIVPVKVFDDLGEGGSIAGLVDAIRWAAGLTVAGVPENARPAAVINLSLGVAGTHPALEAAAFDAWQAGALLVAAAGNHNAVVPDRGVLSPANAPCVIAVGSVDSDHTISGFSNHGPQMELLAPGGYSSANAGCGKVYSTVPPTLEGGEPPAKLYGCLAGTSMASPFVAGVAALLVGQGEFAGPAEIRTRLSETAFLSDTESDHAYYGNGVVCADAALGAASRCGLPIELSEAAGAR